MGILDNARYAEIGKKAEAQKVANTAIQTATPHIEKGAIKRFAPDIMRQGESSVLAKLGINVEGRGLEGLSSYGLN